MGNLRFLIAPSQLPEDWSDLHRAYLNAVDGRVFPTRVEVDGNLLTFRRQTSQSCKLNIVWKITDFGRPVIRTASLSEREEPYVLLLELARGKISTLKDQLSVWQIAGLNIPEELWKLHDEAFSAFSKAAVNQDKLEECSDLAGVALQKAHAAAEMLVQLYARQRLMILHQRAQSLKLPVSLGCNLGEFVPNSQETRQICQAFDAANTDLINWKLIEQFEGDQNWDLCDQQVDWCEKNHLLIRGGCLLDFAPHGLPDWLESWKLDMVNFQSIISHFIETAITRYTGSIRTWTLVSAMNTGGVFGLNEETRLTLTARAIEVAKQTDDSIQCFIRVEQPWGDYLAKGQHQLSPMQFVDAIDRLGVGLSGIDLEFSIGYYPNGSHHHDLLDISKLIDKWSALNLPLHLTLAFPSDDSIIDEKNKSISKVQAGQWKTDWSEAAQAEWIDLYLPLLLAKPAVTGVYWSRFRDQDARRFPHSGLINSEGQAKPALKTITKYHQQYWRS
ncbi:endo-1,4-beta-xylanase [Gimesia fumaroli]|uniref:endo-1,4-beta-xylanase n=1 Tax=Gimesia fumaroli TaxID=2527976 RepID=A0A518I6R1_9PLAN|nr:endo-1,4-beta-xylanase [Gimesia fumaroli]QDV48774.1 Glycosyl hydrolase family 10 [Gimesia fumaroli]